MTDRKGRMTPLDIRNAAKAAIRVSDGVPSKRVIDRAMNVIRAFDNGGMTAMETEEERELREAVEHILGPNFGKGMPMPQAKSMPQVDRELAGIPILPARAKETRMPPGEPGMPTGYVEENPRPPVNYGETGGMESIEFYEPKKQLESIKMPAITKELESIEKEDMLPILKQSTFVRGPDDRFLMSALDPANLPTEQSPNMATMGRKMLAVAFEQAATELARAQEELMTGGNLTEEQRDKLAQRKVDAEDRMSRIKDEMDLRNIATLDSVSLDPQGQEPTFEELQQQTMDEARSNNPEFVGPPSPKPPSFDKFFQDSYRGGGMTGMKKHMGAYGHGGMGGMGAYAKGGMTGKFDDHPALKGKQKTNIPDSLQEAIINKSGMKARAGGGMVGMKRMPAYEEGGMTGMNTLPAELEVPSELREENIKTTAQVLMDDKFGPFSDFSEKAGDYVDPRSPEAALFREQREANFQAMAKARKEQARATPLFAELMKTTKDPNFVPTSELIRSFEETPSFEELESGIGSIATYPEYLKWVQSKVDFRARGGNITRGSDYYWGMEPKYNDAASTLEGYERFVERRIRDMQLSDISDEVGHLINARTGLHYTKSEGLPSRGQSFENQPMERMEMSAYRYGGMTGSKKK